MYCPSHVGIMDLEYSRTFFVTIVSYLETAKELWDDIKERFSVVNGPCIQQLKLDLTQRKQGGLSMVAYHGKLKALWDDLANYEQLSTCTCKGLTCGVAAKLEKRREEERDHTFFMGQDDGLYRMVRSNLLEDVLYSRT